MIYEYKCRTCGAIATSRHRADTIGPCDDPDCSGRLTRLYSISVKPGMQEHFNPTVGKHISSMRQFSDELKVASEEYTMRTGIEAKFVPHDPHDAKALGVTGEGLDTTNRERVAKGLRPVEPKL